MDSPLVAENEAWYVSRPDYIRRFVDRGSLYLHHIVEEVEKRGMPMEIALLPVIESAFTPKAHSRAKASGLWQFIPSTGKNYGLTQDWWRDNRNDVVAATSAALNYLQRLHDMFGSWELALAAYNSGEGRVSRAIAANQKKGLPTDFLSLKLPDETRNYVPRLIAVKNIVLAPASYGIELESVPDQPYFTAVPAPHKIDVPLAAKYHHERLDGRGYPDGLTDQQIPIGAKIVSLADSFDAMTTDRPYRRRRSFEDVVRDLRESSGKQFDGKVVAAFARAIRKEVTGETKDRRITKMLGKGYLEGEHTATLLTDLIEDLEKEVSRKDAKAQSI